MLLALALSLSLAPISAAPSDDGARLARLLPCTPGLAVEYVVEVPDGAGPGVRIDRRIVDTVRGPGREPHTCVIDRVTKREGKRDESDSYARELLPDRISHMGWSDQPLALRPPILKLPLAVGARWHFNTTDYEILAVDETVTLPAGKLSGCVTVSERSSDGSYASKLTYAPDVGLVVWTTKAAVHRAVRISAPRRVR